MCNVAFKIRLNTHRRTPPVWDFPGHYVIMSLFFPWRVCPVPLSLPINHWVCQPGPLCHVGSPLERCALLTSCWLSKRRFSSDSSYSVRGKTLVYKANTPSPPCLHAGQLHVSGPSCHPAIHHKVCIPSCPPPLALSLKFLPCLLLVVHVVSTNLT